MRIAILGSGTGTNAEAILNVYKDNGLGFAIVEGIISDNEEAKILELGPRFDVKAQYIHPGPSKSKLDGEAEENYITLLKDWDVELVVLAGFMRIVKKKFLEAFNNNVINLHPSLLPAFKGLDAIRQAWDYGVKISGCTVHYVDAGIDTGAIIDQMAIAREEEDTFETFKHKIHLIEHELLPKVIKLLCEK